MLTNKNGLPQEIYNAVNQWASWDGDPDPTHYRVTELIRPARQVILQRRHADELEVDIADLMNAFRGSAIHDLLSKYDEHNVFKEIMVDTEVGGKKIRGKPDYYTQDGTLADYKNCKVWKFIYQDFSDWIEQLNIYAYMMRANGFPVHRIGVVALFDDWSKMKAETTADYPKAVCLWIPLVVLTDAEVEAMLKKRIDKLEKAKAVPDEKLPHCTPGEMWEEPTLYKVCKVGNKNAYRNKNSMLEAETLAKEMTEKSGHLYEVRVQEGERKRCKHYCPVSSICNQWAEYQVRLRGDI